ncbi:MAG: hypothetical protein HY964_10155 [Ignavibacteriales bacterium]|nr:hypothetical protein [Ignavibacteriales bacterium]
MKIKIILFILLALTFVGCPPQKPVLKEVPLPPQPVRKEVVPDINLRIASIDISKYGKKIEKSEIQKFASQLKHDSIDILTMQGITRYPELKTRIDIVDQLAIDAEMRKAFGETITLSGRQSGNGIFTIYPIRSSENLQFDNIKSTGFEAAMQTIVDCGAQSVVVVSTQITDKATPADISKIIKSIEQLPKTFSTYPIIISGNINPEKSLSNFVVADERKKDDTPAIWYNANGTMKVLGGQIEQTVFGKMNVVLFGVFSKAQP